ncbi:MAG: hypothetical protein JNL60_12480 [Bacteroidia bacterium]|nr:hypothetical protein [Bacteroidia bacterium]
MNIKIGPYTELLGLQLSIKGIRDDDEHLLLRYEGPEPPSSDFKKSNHEQNVYYKTILKEHLDNGYWIQTHGLYKGFHVEVIPLNTPDQRMATIMTNDQTIGEALDFLKVSGDKYAKDIEISDLEKIWEERKPYRSLDMQ